MQVREQKTILWLVIEIKTTLHIWVNKDIGYDIAYWVKLVHYRACSQAFIVVMMKMWFHFMSVISCKVVHPFILVAGDTLPTIDIVYSVDTCVIYPNVITCPDKIPRSKSVTRT
jgi:hypothetical protein